MTPVERPERVPRKLLLPLLAAVGVSLFIYATTCLLIYSRPLLQTRSVVQRSVVREWTFVDGQQRNMRRTSSISSSPRPPALAYLISGSKGDGKRMVRLLKALYHPLNEYLLHLDLESRPEERVGLAREIALDRTYTEVGNVHMVAKANLVTYRGSTMLANTLHGMAILLRKRKDWDWFINLSASDYPLLPQDDILHVLSYLPRDLNFAEHTSKLLWKLGQRVRPIVVDPGVYAANKTDLITATEKRALPSRFRVFDGSAWMMLSREFAEYCVTGYDNLPRLLLMYFTNMVSSPEFYFQTVLCNSPEFRNTTVNHDLHFIPWDTPKGQHPRSVMMSNWKNLTEEGVLFARKFKEFSPVLDRIDHELLHREPSFVTPGGWCIGPKDGDVDPCSVRGDPTVLKPGPGSLVFQQLVLRLLSKENFRPNQCIFHPLREW